MCRFNFTNGWQKFFAKFLESGFFRHQKRLCVIAQALVITDGGPPGTRTLGPLIKSQLLYQLS
jgi:hypothetical protein